MENIQINPNRNPNNETVNLREIIIKYIRKWYWFVISFFICFLIAFLYLKITVPDYDVKTTILLRQDQTNIRSSETAILESMGMLNTSKEVEDEILVLKSKTLMQSVIQDLGVETEYYERKGMRYEDIYPEIPIQLIVPSNFNNDLKELVELKVVPFSEGYKIKFKSGEIKDTYLISSLNESINTPVGVLRFKAGSNLKKDVTYKIKSFPIRTLTEEYCEDINIASASRKSNAINITTIAPNVYKAKTVLNKLIELYNLEAVIDKNMIARNTKKFIEERLELIKEELLNIEIDVENYKKSNNLTSISSEAGLSEAGLFLQTSSEYYNKKLAEIETQLNLVSYIESHVKDSRNQYSLIPANLGIEDKSLIELIKNYNEALLEHMKIMRTTNNENPVITQMEQQLKTLRSSIIVSIGAVKDGLNIAKKDVLGKEAQFTSKIKQVPTQERKYIEIKRQQEIKQKLYLFLLQRHEENALNLASAIPTAKTLDAAYSSINPVKPKILIIFALTLILSIFIPIIVIYVIDLLNNKIANKKELTRLVKAPYLGSIGIHKGQDRVVVREGEIAPIVEMFRMIRTNLQFMLGGKTSPVILITSSIGGEGKSFAAINLAMSFALLNKKVILVDLDIRKPTMDDYLHIAKNKGVSLYLSNPDYTLNDIIIPSGIHPSLKVIPAGPIPPNPTELLMSSRLEDMIKELKQEFDYIIIDSAPVGVVSDTYLINRVVDNSIYVSRQNYTPKELTDLINEIYTNNKLNNIGLILNGVTETSGYGYGYYGANQDKTRRK